MTTAGAGERAGDHARHLDELRRDLRGAGAVVVSELPVGPLRDAVTRAAGGRVGATPVATRVEFTLGDRRGSATASTVGGHHRPVLSSSFGVGSEVLTTSLRLFAEGRSGWTALDAPTNAEVARLYSLVVEHYSGALATLTRSTGYDDEVGRAVRAAYSPEDGSRREVVLVARLLTDLAAGAPLEWVVRRARAGR